MTRHAARKVHAYALAGLAAAAIVGSWAWHEATKPIQWAGRLTEGPKS